MVKAKASVAKARAKAKAKAPAKISAPKIGAKTKEPITPTKTPIKEKVGKATAATPPKRVLKRQATAATPSKGVLKRPACSRDSSWESWAKEPAVEKPVDEEKDGVKDTSSCTKAQAHAFEKALQLPEGTPGALPQEIHELWQNYSSGPGACAMRNAIRNAIVPKNAGYGHVCTVSPNGALMQKVKSLFKQALS